MRILCISDTHNKHQDLNQYLSKEIIEKNGVDTIIHSGDFTNDGTYDEVEDFVSWFCELPIRNKVLIAGNHERALDNFSIDKDGKFVGASEESDKCINLILNAHVEKKLYYLENDTAVIDGLKFFGSPHTRRSNYYSTAVAFQYNDVILSKIWESIPTDTDVLVTHTPPFGIMDEYSKTNHGSESLLEAVKHRVKPVLHVFGHVHARYGSVTIDNTMFVNAALVSNKKNIKHPPHLIDI